MTINGNSRLMTYIVGEEMSVSRWPEPFTDEIPQMPKTDKDHVAEVGREQNVIGRVLFFMVGDGLANGVLRGETVFFIRAMAKLRMDGVEDLL